MDVDPDLKELIRLTGELGVTELRVEQGELHIHIRRQAGSGVVDTAEVTSAPATEHVKLPEGMVLSPLVGRFYWSAEDDGSSGLAAGQDLREGQRVGFIETMHVMNEVIADVAGEVLEVLVEAGQPVEYGQPLLRVRLTSAV